jgi:hypothetical protein
LDPHPVAVPKDEDQAGLGARIAAPLGLLRVVVEQGPDVRAQDLRARVVPPPRVALGKEHQVEQAARVVG